MQASSASTSIQPQGTYARCSPTTRLTPLLPKVCFLLTAQVPARRPAPQRPPLAPLPKVNSRLPKPGLPRPPRPGPVQGKPVWDLQSRVRLLHCPSPRRPLASRLCVHSLPQEATGTPGWPWGGRKQTSHVLTSPRQPRAAAACLRALRGARSWPAAGAALPREPAWLRDEGGLQVAPARCPRWTAGVGESSRPGSNPSSASV